MSIVHRNFNSIFPDRIFFIKDADYEKLAVTSYSESNLFLTDCHDLEMMILHNSGVENKLCIEYLDGNRKHLVNEVLDDLKYFSFLRWYDASSTELAFDGVLSSAYNGSIQLTYKACLENPAFIQKNKGRNIPSEQDLKDFESVHKSVDLFQLCVGHDVCFALSKKINHYRNAMKIKGKTPVHGENDMSERIRFAYSFDDFRKTELYKALDKWGHDHGLNLWG